MRAKKPRATHLILFILSIFSAYLYIDRANIGTAAGVMKEEFGLTNVQLGVMFSAFSYAYTSIVWIGGWLADRYGVRATLFVCGTVFSIGTIFTGLAGSWTELLLARGIVGLGEAPSNATISRALVSWTRPLHRGFAISVTHGSSRLGTAITPPLVAWLITMTSWRGSFLVLGTLGLVLMTVWLYYYRDDPRTHPSITPDELVGLDPPETQSRVPYFRLLRRYVPSIVTFFCYGWTLWIYLNWLPSFFAQNYHIDLKTSAILSSTVLVAGILGDLSGGILSDRLLARTSSLLISRTYLISGSFLATIVCMVPILISADITVVTIALMLAFFFVQTSVSPQWLVTMDISPRFVGTAGCFLSIGFALSGMLSPTVFGYLVDALGNWRGAFGASMILLAAGAVSALWLRPDRPFVEGVSREGPKIESYSKVLSANQAADRI
ncbi:MFS transporter [Bradyrhizobium sp. AZCC 2230]|uniref:MFS transporter n=1 Tax=Bradyrhizobium sp. AZCC 2230 TaxID=3117021 RepID=UPI002FF00B1D